MQDSDDPRPLLKDDAKKSNNLSDADAPTDHGNHVYLIMMLLGVGSLFGWNIFINAVKYFQSQLVGSRWHAYVINYVTVAFQVFNTCLQLFFTVFPQDIAMPMLLLNTLVFGGCLALVFVNGPEHPDLFFFCTVGSALVLGVCCAGISCTIFGFAGRLPPAYIQGVMVGQALGGIICAVALVAFSSLFPDKSEGMSPHAATAYFAMALIVLCACMAGYIFVNRHPFFLYYSERAKAEERVDSMRRTGSILGKDSLLRETWPLINTLGWAVGYNFAVTLAAFPGLTVDVYPYGEYFSGNISLWIGLYCFLLFNVGDWTGRMLAGWVDSYRRRTGAGPLFAGPKILTLIALRTGFIVLFLLCNHKPQNTKDAFHGSLREGWPTPFTNDAFPVIFMILFAVSNGFCGTVCMMSAPQIVSAAQGKQAGTLMASCLVIGIAAGSVLSFGVTFIYTGQTPWDDPPPAAANNVTHSLSSLWLDTDGL